MSHGHGSRTILITGGTRGLGAALTHEFVARGHAVALCGRSPERVERMGGLDGVQAHAVDVTDASCVQKWADDVLASGAVPDLLINNAGVINEPAPLWEVSPEEFQRVVSVNLIGVANVVRAFAPAMIAAGRGVIANLSSGWGRSTSPEVAPYCATKWGVEGLTQALAQELPRGLAAVAVNPGVIDTDMLRTAWADGAASYPKAEVWAQGAAPFFLSLDASDNGRAVTAPG